MDYYKEIMNMAKSSGQRLGQFMYCAMAKYIEEKEGIESNNSVIGDKLFFIGESTLYEACKEYLVSFK